MGALYPGPWIQAYQAVGSPIPYTYTLWVPPMDNTIVFKLLNLIPGFLIRFSVPNLSHLVKGRNNSSFV